MLCLGLDPCLGLLIGLELCLGLVELCFGLVTELCLGLVGFLVTEPCADSSSSSVCKVSPVGNWLEPTGRWRLACKWVVGDSVDHLGWETNYDQCRDPRINETDHLAV